jgi:uncharacterized caspase-like protein
MVAGDGARYSGCIPLSKTSMTIIRPPQQGHGGKVVVYSARHGQTASDGIGDNSPFVEALVKEIDQPGVEVDMVFRKVRDQVLKSTGGEQEPFIYGSLPGKEFFFKNRTIAETGTNNR